MLKGKSNIASEDMIEKSTNDWSIVAMVDTNTKNQNDTETDDEDFVMTSTQISNNDGEEKRDSPTYDDIEKALEGKEIPASEILKKIQKGETVKYDHAIIKGNLVQILSQTSNSFRPNIFLPIAFL